MRLATDFDYKRVQGGRPDIFFEDGLWHIQHWYLPGAPVVRTHHDPSIDEVTLDLDGETVLFKARELWRFEGAPCERVSRANGGHGYDRILNRRSPYVGHKRKPRT